jgi:phosphoglycerate kinase
MLTFIQRNIILKFLKTNPGYLGIILVRIPRAPTIDDIDPRNSKVLIRIDINSPIDPETGRILDTTRFKSHVRTIKELVVERNNALVLMSHQGRPGSTDFVLLNNHSRILSEHLGMEVRYIDDIIGPAARNAIDSLNNGEILLLENTRLLSEETIEMVPEKHATSIFVRRLSEHFDYYVNDAFATAHRSQPSIVGFPLVLPSSMGRLMEKEVNALSKVFNPEVEPKIFVLGGAKVHDTLRIIEHIVANKVADRILTTGLVAFLFMVSKGIDIGKQQKALLEKKGILPLVPRARRLLLKGAPVETPIDFKVEMPDGSVEIRALGSLDGPAKDIGPQTVTMYGEFFQEARIIVMRGPAGVIEDDRFKEGTVSLVEKALASGAFTIFGGGHFNAIFRELNNKELVNRVGHLSTGGGALLLFLAGEPLPALEALNMSARKFLGW